MSGARLAVALLLLPAPAAALGATAQLAGSNVGTHASLSASHRVEHVGGELRLARVAQSGCESCETVLAVTAGPTLQLPGRLSPGLSLRGGFGAWRQTSDVGGRPDRSAGAAIVETEAFVDLCVGGPVWLGLAVGGGGALGRPGNLDLRDWIHAGLRVSVRGWEAGR